MEKLDFISSVLSFFNSPVFKMSVRLLAFFLIILWASVIYWTYRDAEKRGAIGIYWAAVVLFFNLFGFIIYLILRPPEYLADVQERELEIREKEEVLNLKVCSGCHHSIEPDFLICPYCMKKLKKSCPVCNRPLDLNWTVCPYCKTSF